MNESKLQELIDQVGNANFSVCDDSWDEPWRHPKHPHVVRIMDCEGEVTIDVEGYDDEHTSRIATCLCKILNQEF